MKDSKRENYRHYFLSYLSYDNLVSFGQIDIFFKNQRSDIKNYINVGCFWSELIKSIPKESINIINIQTKELNKCKYIIGVFDTSFFDQTVLKYEDGVRFFQDISRLLIDFPEIGMVFKEKNPRAFVNCKLLHFLNTLEKHPRCYITGSNYDSSEAIRISDLVISVSFTTPTIEALDIKQKAIYFDPLNRFRNTYPDMIPNLVAHNYEELKHLVKYWLYDMNQNDFNKYFETHIKDHFSLFGDGKAITRFRELLVKGN
jgi:polysaccharide biosynthesis PFTS motif protein